MGDEATPHHPPSAGRSAVVVTGASTGIGRATALRLAELGFHVLAGVRREADGDRLASDASGALTPLSLDVTDQGSTKQRRARSSGRPARTAAMASSTMQGSPSRARSSCCRSRCCGASSRSTSSARSP